MDILSFALDCVAAETGMDRAALRPLERRIRQEQGGDRHYIGSTWAMDTSERHATILRALASGATPAQVAERVGVSRQAIYLVKQKSEGAAG